MYLAHPGGREPDLRVRWRCRTAGCACCEGDGERELENVTGQPPARGLSFIATFTPSRILPGDGNYRY